MVVEGFMMRNTSEWMRERAWLERLARVASAWKLVLLGLGGVAVVFLTGLRAGDDDGAEVIGVRVAAAADLKFAMDELLAEFGAMHPGIRPSVTYGSSGNFHAQIRHGAPFDLYFSADIEYPRALAEEGMALDDEVFHYAVGRLVVWVPRSSSLDVKTLGIRALLDPAVGKVAIANPQHAPYGKAAVAAMRSLGVYEEVGAKLVMGENISQAAHFVESGAADIGIIALALALAPEMTGRGDYWEIPDDAYPRMEQGGLVVRGSRHVEAAKALRDFVLGERGRPILERYGFILPED